MRSFRRPLVLAVAATLVLAGLSACGGDNEDEPVPLTGNRATTTTFPEEEPQGQPDVGSDPADANGPTTTTLPEATETAAAAG